MEAINVIANHLQLHGMKRAHSIQKQRKTTIDINSHDHADNQIPTSCSPTVLVVSRRAGSSSHAQRNSKAASTQPDPARAHYRPALHQEASTRHHLYQRYEISASTAHYRLARLRANKSGG
jgi:hypothetical protein